MGVQWVYGDVMALWMCVRGLCVSEMDLWGRGMNLWVHNGSVHTCGGFKGLFGHRGTKGPQ